MKKRRENRRNRVRGNIEKVKKDIEKVKQDIKEMDNKDQMELNKLMDHDEIHFIG